MGSFKYVGGDINTVKEIYYEYTKDNTLCLYRYWLSCRHYWHDVGHSSVGGKSRVHMVWYQSWSDAKFSYFENLATS